MSTFSFTHYAKKKFLKLDVRVQRRILDKLAELRGSYDTRSMKSISGIANASHRLRIGDYRLILQHQSDDDFIVVDLDHRSRIYKK